MPADDETERQPPKEGAEEKTKPSETADEEPLDPLSPIPGHERDGESEPLEPSEAEQFSRQLVDDVE